VQNLIEELPEKTQDENLTAYAERLSSLYSESCKISARKNIGQFFTPKEISLFMAGKFNVYQKELRVLDPGAGTGTLTAAMCERLVAVEGKLKITTDVYENDEGIMPFLERTLSTCKKELKKHGKELDYTIHNEDFVKANMNAGISNKLYPTKDPELELYDFVISNPPYFKLGKDQMSKSMRMLAALHPNIYALFITVAISKLKPNGEAVFITPRSFCSGTYYNNFRWHLLNTATIKDIHLFESRKEVFHDDVLQESVIMKFKKENQTKNMQVIISISKTGKLSGIREMKSEYDDIVYKKGHQIFIRIPDSKEDVKILHTIDKWPNFITDLGLEISTGPIIDFRSKEYLIDKPNGKAYAPLLWMHNMKDFKIEWPAYKKGKASAILISSKSARLLVPMKNYVLVKRFSSKEQARRLYAVPFLKSDLDAQSLGIENHVNYIHKVNGNMSADEAIGLAAILNTTLIDRYFRALNGNTQVNATDMRNMPLPSLEKICLIGKIISTHKGNPTEAQFDEIVISELNINEHLLTTGKELA
jgi:adenine-specific DNA-methyltransferase